MAQEDMTLELLLNKATSPALYDEDWDAIAAFCDQVNKQLEGPQFAVQLLAHKMQSPTEREALSALSTLESCVKHCGVSFHKEIGKFRFLNEIIKVLSPKFLGSRTTERVKKRCIELMYSWHKGLPHETKIAEAYKMLKDQHIILEDPTYMDKTFEPFPVPKPRRADFEDEEKAKDLERLLKSKSPKDLKAANKLIKELVKEDVHKSEKRLRRERELKTISTQGKLLAEMVKQYQRTPDEIIFNTMKELHQTLEKQRPELFKLAGDTEKHEIDAMNDILKANDEVTKAMLLYMKAVEGMKGREGSAGENGMAESPVKDSSLLDLGVSSQEHHAQSSPEPASGASAMLQADFHSLGLGGSPPAASPYSNLGSLFTANQQQQQQQQQQTGPMSLVQAAMGAPGAAGFPVQNKPMEGGAPPVFGQNNAGVLPSATNAAQPQYFAAAQQINASMVEPSVFSASTLASSATVAASSSAAAAASSAMADIDALGQSLLEQNRTKDFVRPPAVPPPKPTMNQLAAAKTASPQQQQPLPQSSSVLDSPLQPVAATGAQPNSVQMPVTNGTHAAATAGDMLMNSPVVGVPVVPAPTSSLQEALPLTDVFVPLENIKPAEGITPLTIYDKNGLKSMIHFSGNRPRPDVLAMVVSTLSTNVKPVSSFVFQAAVPKVMKVKLQPPSSSSLPAFSPIQPPAAITQIILIANPRKETIRLKFKISYVLGEDPVCDGGDVENFPLQ